MQIEHILLLCGIVAGPLFIAIFILEGAFRADYDVLRQPVSALSLGKRGWIQRINFFINGILTFLCGCGLIVSLIPYGGSLWISVLFGMYCMSLIGAAIFNTDPTRSPNSAPHPKHTVHGRLHIFFSLIIFLSLLVAYFVFAHLFIGMRSFSWATYSILSGVLYGMGLILFAYGFSRPGKLKPIAGLLERITIIIGLIWLTLIATHFLLIK